MQSVNQFYYRVRAETTFGKAKALIDGITESITAETLAEARVKTADKHARL